jgi:uncharacterized protein (DUF2345 family)
MLGTL